MAIIASPIGTARMPTQGSWRPFTVTVAGSPVAVMLDCGRAMLLVGLKATWNTIVSPFEMPP